VRDTLDARPEDWFMIGMSEVTNSTLLPEDCPASLPILDAADQQ